MTRLSKSPDLRWFDEIPKCSGCGKLAQGKLMGSQNQSFGWHCKRCADRRLAASAKVRSTLTSGAS